MKNEHGFSVSDSQFVKYHPSVFECLQHASAYSVPSIHIYLGETLILVQSGGNKLHESHTHIKWMLSHNAHFKCESSTFPFMRSAKAWNDHFGMTSAPAEQQCRKNFDSTDRHTTPIKWMGDYWRARHLKGSGGAKRTNAYSLISFVGWCTYIKNTPANKLNEIRSWTTTWSDPVFVVDSVESIHDHLHNTTFVFTLKEKRLN